MGGALVVSQCPTLPMRRVRVASALPEMMRGAKAALGAGERGAIPAGGAGLRVSVETLKSVE